MAGSRKDHMVMNRIIKSMEEKYLIPSAQMVQELIPGGLEGIHGQVCYSEYKSLQ